MPTEEQTAGRQRVLEGWLPLAAAASEQYGWGLDGPGLARLILRAGPRLAYARSWLEACAILWSEQRRHQEEDSR